MASSEDLRQARPGKTVIIGLDGVPYSLLSDLIAKGVLTNMVKYSNKATSGGWRSVFRRFHRSPGVRL